MRCVPLQPKQCNNTAQEWRTESNERFGKGAKHPRYMTHHQIDYNKKILKSKVMKADLVLKC